MELPYIILLGLAVSIDGFFAGIAYGLKGIRIPSLSLIALTIVTFLCTACGAYGSHFLLASFHSAIAAALGSALLILIGTASLLRQFFSTPAAADGCPNKEFTFSFGKIVIRIIAKPECADMDDSKSLSVSEALLLGTALGIDNMAATFAAGLSERLPAYTPLLMSAIQTALVYGGIIAARQFASPQLKNSLAYAPGIVLICIGLCRLL